MIPAWLPDAAATYVAHTGGGQPLRALARAKGCHASTVMRQVRRVEAWRDDPLIDEALERLIRDPRRRLRRQCRPQGVARHALTGRCASTDGSPTRGSSARRAASCAGCARRARSSRWRRRWRRRWCCARWCRASRTASPWSTATWRTPSRCRNGSAATRPARSPATRSPPVGRAALKRLLTEERAGREPQPAASPRRRRRSRSSTASSPSAR